MRGGIRRFAAVAVATGISWPPSAALAQASTVAAVEHKNLIEVTGSRVIALDVESASPIYTITAEEIRSEGHTSLEMILNNFPQFVADQGARVSNGASGTSTANLRGLLPGRTLVLLNGRRLLSGSPFLLAADLNQVPMHLISRVEVLTGGASAVHGSDAIAGVVNVILNDRFEGVEGTVAYDFYNHRQKNDFAAGLTRAAGYEVPGDKGRDGATATATLTVGGNFAGDKGNAVVSFRYVESDALLQSDRDYSACALSWVDFGLPHASVACGGSGVSYPGRFQDVANGRIWTVADASGGVRPFVRATDLYNFAPTNYYQRPIERNGFNAFARYDITPATRAYGEFGFHDDHTVAQIAPSGVFGGFQTVRWENPLLSADWRSRLVFRNPDGTVGTGPGTSALLVVGRRNVEGGGRQYEKNHTSYRQVLGLKGSFADAWDYDAYYQAAKVVASERSTADFSITRIRRALDVVSDPRTGAPVCASAANGSDPACVPWDIWRLGGVTQEALDYLQLPANRQGFTAQSLLSATVRGDLDRYGARLPWTKDAIQVAFGVERRSDKMDLVADSAYSSGDLAGAGESLPAVKGRVVVKEIFGEARVPVLDSLDLTGSFRYSDYSTGATSDTFGLGFNAMPHGTVRLRGSWQRAVRAPNLVELFVPQRDGGWSLVGNDPCEGETPRASLDGCARTGVAPARYGRIPVTPSVPYIGTIGGNPALEPETANTVTLGIALTPSKDFSATLDYFDIRIDDFIADGQPGEIFLQCLETGDPLFCGLVTRDPVLGTLWLPGARVVGIDLNAGRARVTGFDFAFTYRYGSLVQVSGIGTYLQRSDFEILRGGRVAHCAGFYYGGCLEPRPRWRHRVRAAWQLPWSVELATTWRYIHSMRNGFGFGPELEPMSYLDLAFSWAIDKRVTLRGGVNNVADRDPPLIPNAGGGVANGNTFAQTYDALGRYVFVNLNVKF